MSEPTLAPGDTLPAVNVATAPTLLRFEGLRLDNRLGEGGMGEVWLAEQLEPVHRQVAVKVIKAGMDSKEVVARFESERQALALMDHPAIAKVFDGGTTPEGRPFFVMEYVAGPPITEYCDERTLSTTERLELFAEVCEGVQHAHQKAIIHRDLKPSNILVAQQDGRAQPKIIDFGIAKALGYRLTNKTLFTEVGVVIGTPEYMSPEQADSTGEDVDTRTDVYSLGVVLYQLLTGELPFASHELRSSSDEELRRKLRESDPPRPSTRLSKLDDRTAEAARARNTDPGTLQRELEGDLDAITMKALEKDRTRRYGTPSELAADIRRHLRHEPVVARPASPVYRLRKYLRRHRVGVGLAAGVATLLVGFAVTMAVQARKTALERDRANREAATARNVSSFLTRMFNVSDPSEARGNTITAREILDRASKELETGLDKDPELQVRMMNSIGSVYTNLGLLSRARPLEARALELGRTQLGPDHGETLFAADQLTIIHEQSGRYAEAEALAVDTLERKRRVFGPEEDRTLSAANNLGLLYLFEGKLGQAERLLSQVLLTRRRQFGDDGTRTLQSANNLAEVYLRADRLDRADELLGATLEGKRRVFGPDHPSTLNTITNLGILRNQQHRLAESEKLFREVRAAQRRVLGPEHPDTLGNTANLGWVLSEEGLVLEGEKLMQDAVESERRALGLENPFTLDGMMKLAGHYIRHGRVDAGEHLVQEALEAQTRMVPSDNPDRAWMLAELGLVALKRGQTDAAIDDLETSSAHGLTPDWVSAIRSDSAWSALRGHPRFVRWVGRAAPEQLSSANPQESR